MLVLASTSDLVRITTTSATATLTIQASWVNLNGTTVTPGRTNTAVSGAVTNTTLVGSPASASDYRTVKGLDIANTHATLSQVVEVNHWDGATSCILLKCTLLAGESADYDGNNWTLYDTAGGVKVVGRSGRYLRTSVILNGTTAFVTGPDTNTIFCRLMAGGGAGGGCTSVASAAAGAGGGGGGGYAEKTFAVTPNTSYVVAVGAGGTGVSAAAGNPGGNTTIAVGGVTVTANGGLGGAQAVPTTTLTVWMGGASGAVSTNGDVNEGGAPGEAGIVLIIATPIVLSGNGGSSNFGSGALGIKAVGNGTNATIGFGGGGSGSATGASVARTGGNGANGVLVIDEYA
jgi:hypothetical protein